MSPWLPQSLKNFEENQSYIDSVSNADESINDCSLSSKALNLEKVNSLGNELLSRSQSILNFVPDTKTYSAEYTGLQVAL